MSRKKVKFTSNSYLKLSSDEFNELNRLNIKEDINNSFLYEYELIQYQPFGENTWYEIKLKNIDQKTEILSLIGGEQSTGRIINGTISPAGEVNGGSYIQEKNSDGMILTKFVKLEDIKSNQEVLI